MTRAFLKSLFPKDMEGLDGIIDSIMQAHGTGIETEKAKTTAVNEQIATLKSKVTDLEKKLATAGDDSEAVKNLTKVQAELDTAKADLEQAKTDHATALKAEQDAHTATKTGYETERTNSEMDKAVSAELKTAGYSEAAIPLFLKAGYDRTQLKKESDGKIAGVDKLVESLKADPVHSTFFGEVKIVGAEVGGTQGTGDNLQGGKPLTLEAIKKMTPEEINKNWDAVQAAMKKG